MTNRIGAYLRQKREEEHLTLGQVAEHTGIRENYLSALEDGHFSMIPGDVFIRGFLRKYGNYLGLDGNLVVEVYRMDLNPEKILGKLSKPLAESPAAEPVPERQPLQQQKEAPATSDTIIMTPPLAMTKNEKQEAECNEAEADQVEEAGAESDKGEETGVRKKQVHEADAKATGVDKDQIAEAGAAAAVLNEEQDKATEEDAEKRKVEAAAALAAAEAGSSKGRFHSLVDTVKDFIDENLYETVPDDEDEEIEEEDQEEPVKEPAKPAFSFKVFSGVFLVCLLIFTVVMAYFIFGGKAQEELKPTTQITDGVKSDHSSEKSEEAKKAEAEKAAKEAEEKKKKEEEEKKKKAATNKTLGLGSKVTVQIRYKKGVWTQTHVDGKVVEAAVIPAGSTRTYKGDREVRLNLGSIRDVEITVNGHKVPYGEKEWGVANKVFTPRS